MAPPRRRAYTLRRVRPRPRVCVRACMHTCVYGSPLAPHAHATTTAECMRAPVRCGPQDVLLYYGATEYGAGPAALGSRSPRQSFNVEHAQFMRERGSYQAPYAEP